MTFCGKCGAQNPGENAFCGKCGKTLLSSVMPPPPSGIIYGAPAPALPVEKKGSLLVNGCLTVFVLTFIIAMLGTYFDGASQSPDVPTATQAPRPTAKPQPTPIPSATRRERRRQRAAQLKVEREQKQAQAVAKAAREAAEKERIEAEYRAAHPLEFIKDSLDFQAGGESFTSYVAGSVRNNTDHTYSYVQITIGLYDSADNQVGSTIDNVNGLEPGKIWKFKALVSEDNAASCKILDVTGS
jgi:hypothetical protein